MTTKEAIAILERYRNRTGTPGEMQLVDEWYEQLVETGDWQWKEDEKEGMEQLLQETLLKKIRSSEKPDGKVHKMFRWKRVAAAASIFLVLGSAFWLLREGRQKQISGTETHLKKDVEAPLSNKATITLASGKQIILDSAGNGTLAREGNVNVVKLADGQIAYTGSSSEIRYNTLTNPRGSKVINLTLADGSEVWLNAESSLKYPTAFGGNERKVSITGEAYFEIAHDAAKPFTVNKGETSVQVLGTHFNVNTYDDEAEIKITLLEGSVKVVNRLSSILIKPGQQALIANSSADGGIKVIKADTEEVMAWKNGFFQFNGLNIQGVMRQLERWYDVAVRYEGKIPQREFAGQIDRNANLSEVLKILKESNVHFEINGNQIIVKP